VVGTNGRLEEEEEDDGRQSPTATKMAIKSSEKKWHSSSSTC
jgi:hypothetical protein